VPEPAEYVALGAARQAAWVLSGGDEPPTWGSRPSRRIEAPEIPAVRAAYAEARDDLIANLSP
jgi:xylulokinase